VRGRMEVQHAERERIARDLHDTLLQSFQGVLLLLQGVADVMPRLPAADTARDRLNSVIDQTAQAVTEGRKAVQGLRSSTLLSTDFVSALNALGAELANADDNSSTGAFHLEVEGTPRELISSVREEVYRISSEALCNAYRRAQAQRVEVAVHYEKLQL